MIVQMHLSEWEELKIRHTDEVETLHRKLCKAEESVKELTTKIEGNKKTNGYPMVVGLEEQYHQQELSLKEHQAEITHLKLQLKNLEAQRLAELRGKDSVIDGKDKELARESRLTQEQHVRLNKLETELLALRKDAQEALDLAEGKGWTVKVGEPDKGPLFKRISSMLAGADECQKERLLLKAMGDEMARGLADYQKAIFNAGFEVVNGKLKKRKKYTQIDGYTRKGIQDARLRK